MTGKQLSLLQRINNCGRSIAIQCADEKLCENEVVLVLLLYHRFNQLSLDLVEGSIILLPDYTADKFVQLKMKLLSSEETGRSLFIPESYHGKDNGVKVLEVDHDDCMDLDMDDEFTADVLTEFKDHAVFASANQEFVGKEVASEISNSDVPSYKCGQCDSVLKSKKSLNAHIKYKHEGVRFSCKDCSEFFTSNHSLKVHRESIHEGVRYSCDECELVYSTTGHLRKHKLSKHGGLVYECDQCTFRATYRRALNDHKSAVHQGVDYYCDQCDFHTSIERKLKLHIKNKHESNSDSKSNLNDGICELCGYVTANKYKLIKHKQRKHEDIKYHCDQCLFKTGWEKSLKRHKQEKHVLTK